MLIINQMIDFKALKDRDFVEGQLAVRSKDAVGEGLKDYSNKAGRFFVINAGNSTGEIPLKYWGGEKPDKTTELFSSLEVGDVVLVKGRCIHDSYNKSLVISINEEVKYGAAEEFLKKAGTDDFQPEDFIPSLPDEVIKSLFDDLLGFVRGVGDPDLRRLLDSFFGDPDFSLKFKRCPAAMRHHHNYLGGLLEHSVNVAKLCITMCKVYPLNKDLLITGALLHDIGKTKEYRIKAAIDVSDEGRLVGHLMISAEMVGGVIDGLDGFPEAVRNTVIHNGLSHHGDVEYGSPILRAS